MFGSAFAEEFPFAYTRKYWTVEADQMTTDWVGSRMYPPSLSDVVRGAIEPEQSGDFHYLSSFRYPAHGGYQSFLRHLVHEDLIRCGMKVIRLDTSRYGEPISSHSLISTITSSGYGRRKNGKRSRTS